MSIILGHRGASGHAPENTLEAFKLAMDMGAEGFELDVHLSKDGELVVIHDETVDRTTDGKGLVCEKTVAELKALDACNKMEAYRGAKIPTLREVYELILDTDHIVNVEIKTDDIFYPQIEEKCLALEAEMGMKGRIVYSSFNHYTTRKVRELAPDAQIGMLFGDVLVEPYDYCKSVGANLLHPNKANLNVPGFAEKAKEAGLGINVWTDNTEDYMQKCLDCGAGIVTNYPDVAVKLRAAQK